MESKKNLVKAIIKVMQAVKSIDKSLTVGTGQHSYKAVGDKDVKLAIGEAMAKNGLAIIPIQIDEKVSFTKWQEQTTFGIKHKQQVFTEVKTKYLLIHETGESMEVVGYGQGSDNLDKSSGKAMTYALKTTLLHTFLVPTGSIDDTDKTHSNDLEPIAPPQQQTLPPPPPPKKTVPKTKPTLVIYKKDTKEFTDKILNIYSLIKEEQIVSVSDIEKHYLVPKEVRALLDTYFIEAKKLKAENEKAQKEAENLENLEREKAKKIAQENLNKKTKEDPKTKTTTKK